MDEKLVTASDRGDAKRVAALLSQGAAVNEKRKPPGYGIPVLPLRAAVRNRHLAVVALLLSSGADPNGDGVMADAVAVSTLPVLQAVVDAGGDVNRDSDGQLPLFTAICSQGTRSEVESKVSLLLAIENLNVDATNSDGLTAVQYARSKGKVHTASIIALAVRDIT